MSIRLERAKRYRDQISPGTKMRYRPLGAQQDLMSLGAAGAAVRELWLYCHGLAEAHDIAAPLLPALSPNEGEGAVAWVDRVTAELLRWKRDALE